MSDVHILSREVAAAKVLKSVLERYAADDDTLRDMIEGETGLHEAIARVLASITEDEILVSGISSKLTELTSRKDRLNTRIEHQREAVAKAMEVGELQKLQLPEGTLSLRRINPKPVVTDEKQVPKRFFVPQPLKIDKTAINDAMKAGETIPGVEMSNGGIGLTIRRA